LLGVTVRRETYDAGYHFPDVGHTVVTYDVNTLPILNEDAERTGIIILNKY
jgi:hypothetical protein